jgi:SAM-dependent methyltransferase
MHLDAIDLKDFYASPLGAVVRRLLGARIRARWSNLQGKSLFGLGFATPYLGAFRNDAGPIGALMPAELGVISWPREGKGLSVLVDETELPLPDECADRILLVHMLEWSERTRALLRELWRVLAPNGRLLIIVPNRRGLWARVDSTPFGHGRPFSRSQIGHCSRTQCSLPRTGNTRSTCRPSPGASCSNGPCFGSGSASFFGLPSPA